jgi:hypothetical protein
MSLTEVTEQSLIEGRLAAHMALNPTQIPTDVVNFEDFKFGNTMFEAKVGNIETLSSVSTGVSEVASQIAQDIVARDKDEADKDAISLAKESNLSDLQEERDNRRDGITTVPVSFDGTFFTIGKTKFTEEELDDVTERAHKDFDGFAERNGLEGEDKVAADLMVTELMSAQSPQEKLEILAKYAESHPNVVSAYENDKNNFDRKNEYDGSLVETRKAILEKGTTGNTIEDNAALGNAESVEVENQVMEARGFDETKMNDFAAFDDVFSSKDAFTASASPDQAIQTASVEINETPMSKPTVLGLDG